MSVGNMHSFTHSSMHNGLVWDELDLRKAFDLLIRAQLQSTLAKIEAEKGIRHAAMLLQTGVETSHGHPGWRVSRQRAWSC